MGREKYGKILYLHKMVRSTLLLTWHLSIFALCHITSEMHLILLTLATFIHSAHNSTGNQSHERSILTRAKMPFPASRASRHNHTPVGGERQGEERGFHKDQREAAAGKRKRKAETGERKFEWEWKWKYKR